MDSRHSRPSEANDPLAAEEAALVSIARDFMTASIGPKYSYNFTWLGRPIIQYPQDMVAVQEIIWSVQPDLIIETGIAHGGSVVMSASLLAMLDVADAHHRGVPLDVRSPRRRVLGIDIEIRPHNLEAMRNHPLAPWFELIESPSADPAAVDRAHELAANAETVMVLLDSNHSHDHVLAELEAYAHLVTVDSYCIVFDTVIEHLPPDMYPDRNWDVGDNPKTAVEEFLQGHAEFVPDKSIDDKLLISVAPGGYLKRVRGQ